MTVVIDYFYSHVSPWAYLGHQPFRDLAGRHSLEVRPRPVDLAGVFDATGGLPLGKRHSARQALRLIELQRWRDHRDVPLTIKPKHFPTSPRLADRCAVALSLHGGPVMEFSLKAFQAIWAEEQDIAEQSVIETVLRDLGLEPETILGQIDTPEVLEKYQRNQDDAITWGVVGSPTYVLNGEPFWGQDRLQLLEEAIVSGRDPYLVQ